LTINLEERKQSLLKDIEKANKAVEMSQINLKRATQDLDRLVGGLLMLEELLQTPSTPPENSDQANS